MSRIVYFTIARAPTGGQKVAFRHAEALRERGFDAVVCCPQDASIGWFKHNVKLVPFHELNSADVLVVGEDAVPALRHFRNSGNRVVVFCQNHFYAGSHGIATFSQEERKGFESFIACSQTTAAWVRKYFPHASVDIIPAFADERVFKPAAGKLPLISYSPRKLRVHAQYIRNAFNLREPKTRFDWESLEGKSELEVAETLSRSSLFLSLNFLEGLGIMTLEAMAAGCIPVGFTGTGGKDYARSTNGYWVDENDCDAAADALIQAARLIDLNDPVILRIQKEAIKTADDWSFGKSLEQLVNYWTKQGSITMAQSGVGSGRSPRAIR